MGINDVDVRALRRFVAVAEERSFSRAAARLAIAQPPLSRAIRELEDAIGTRLFVRTTRSVELTDAGRSLYAEARGAIAHVESVARRAARAASRAPRLVVAAKPGRATLLNAVIRRYERRAELPRVKVLVCGWGEQAEMLADGRADVAFLHLPLPFAGIQFRELVVEPRVVALPLAHRLARRRVLRRSELDGEPVPIWPRATPEIAAFRAGVDSPAALAHVPPGPPIHDLSQMLEAVALGQGIAFVPSSIRAQSPHEGVVFVPVRDLPPSRGGIGWLSATPSEAVRHFVESAVSEAREARAPVLLP